MNTSVYFIFKDNIGKRTVRYSLVYDTSLTCMCDIHTIANKRHVFIVGTLVLCKI